MVRHCTVCNRPFEQDQGPGDFQHHGHHGDFYCSNECVDNRRKSRKCEIAMKHNLSIHQLHRIINDLDTLPPYVQRA